MTRLSVTLAAAALFAASAYLDEKPLVGDNIEIRVTCSHFCGLGHQKMKGRLTVE